MKREKAEQQASTWTTYAYHSAKAGVFERKGLLAHDAIAPSQRLQFAHVLGLKRKAVAGK